MYEEYKVNRDTLYTTKGDLGQLRFPALPDLFKDGDPVIWILDKNLNVMLPAKSYFRYLNCCRFSDWCFAKPCTKI